MQQYIRNTIGFFMIILGVVLGLYIGIWVLYIGGMQEMAQDQGVFWSLIGWIKYQLADIVGILIAAAMIAGGFWIIEP